MVFYRHRLLLNASLSTSIFSLSYLIISILINFPNGIDLMIFNVLGFLTIPFFMRWKVPVVFLGNLYVLFGTIAVAVLIYFSGGMQSPIFPWLIAPPVLALLIVNRKYSLLWTAVSIIILVVFTVLTGNEHVFPVNYDSQWALPFGFLCSFGIILIVVMIEMIFEKNTTRALLDLESRKIELEKSKEELAAQHDQIIEKNELLTSQREELLITSEQLKELNEKKDNLLYIIAHDLKSPLANIQALVNIIKIENKNINLTEREVLKMISDLALKSQSLIEKILNSENFEKIAYNLNLEKLDVSDILRVVVEDAQNMAANKNISIQFTRHNVEQLTALVDKMYLAQVFENLVSNAIKFSPANKRVLITIQLLKGKIRTEIKDEGPGVKPEEILLLFKKFQKLSNQPTAGESSTGLGLSIVKQYTELLNGEVWCESVVGKGANFIVELPAHG
jgi:signal transduction histidine kinase